MPPSLALAAAALVAAATATGSATVPEPTLDVVLVQCGSLTSELFTSYKPVDGAVIAGPLAATGDFAFQDVSAGRGFRAKVVATGLETDDLLFVLGDLYRRAHPSPAANPQR